MIYNFGSATGDGQSPADGGALLLHDSVLYGVTTYGGSNDAGTVYQYQVSGSTTPESVLYNFEQVEGDSPNPEGPLVRDSSGNLYGVTLDGGANEYGSVYEISPSGVKTVLYSFTGGTDGKTPRAGLVIDPTTGNLFGVVSGGGADGYGGVFQVTPTGTETVLYNFAGAPDVQFPTSRLVMDSKGDLFGASNSGGTASKGTVFELTPDSASSTGYTEKVVHSFAGGTADGQYPTPAANELVIDSAGNLFGTTPQGGANSKGVVYELTPDTTSSTGYTETVLHSFGGTDDGQYPYGGLVIDATTGDLFGTTRNGGTAGEGSVFELTPDSTSSTGYTETVLYSFGGGTTTDDGQYPEVGVVIDPATGNLYGTTRRGGADSEGALYEILR